VKLKLYFTSADEQESQNNSSAGTVLPSGSDSVLSPVTLNSSAATSQISDFEDDVSDVDEDLSETDDEDDLWSCISAVLDQSDV